MSQKHIKETNEFFYLLLVAGVITFAIVMIIIKIF